MENGIRADVVGSLLRPPELVEARLKLAGGELDPVGFKAIEDAAVDHAVALQERVGLAVVTDGEMRRLSFQSQMTEAVEGFGRWDLDAFLWGHWKGAPGVEDHSLARPPELGVTGRLRRRRHLCAEEFTYLRARTTRTPKVTLPSPSLWANFWSPGTGPYPTLDAFFDDVVRLMREEIQELERLGARYIQLDAPHYTLLLDPETRAFYESRGWTLNRWLDRGVDLDNAVMHGFDGITFSVHVCRGNQHSRWLVEGGYETIAEAIFRRTRAERLLLEYDDARSGTFQALSAVPEDKTVVLGLVGTKQPTLEDPGTLVERVGEAARFHPLEQLAVSTQCGFASSIEGNRLGFDDQERKLALVVDVARRVWG